MTESSFEGFGGGLDLDEFAVEYERQGLQEFDLRKKCEEFFSSGGILSRSVTVNGIPCEERPQQLSMSVAVADALTRGENLCVEAPTGVGKSFAYLVPLIFYAVECGRQVLVSTETINLQHQLIEKDLPFLQNVIGVQFKVALAKGRSNYLCRRRLALLAGDQKDALLPIPQMAEETQSLIRDLENGRDSNYVNGIRDTSRIWHLVCSESGNCAGPKCEFYRSCYYFKARRKWDEADIVVANHALFLTDLAIRQESGNAGTLLPDYKAVMIDEAHTLENNAAMHLGIRLSRAVMLSAVNRLYNPERTKGLLMRSGADMLELRAAAQRLREEIYGFFAPYCEILEKSGNSSVRFDEKTPDILPETLINLFISVAEKLGSAAEAEDDDNFRTEMGSAAEKCRSFAEALSCFTARQMPEAVYFIEKEDEQNSIACCAAPLNVAQLLAECLFNGDMPVMLCSATMTVAQRFDYFLSRTGFVGGGTVKLDSPFSPDQARLIISRDMPEPASQDYHEKLAESIWELVEKNRGCAFVLFTSYQSMKFCGDHLRDRFGSAGFPLMIQGENMTRTAMLRSFQEASNPVLFGTDSFWTGVDVPGDNLSLVIITRLPFASIGSPLTSARMEKLENSGISSFMHYSLPEAVLKFRQGTGRLIRTSCDRGIIAVLDSRIVKRRYGMEFIKSLPYAVEEM